jgi:hypothetical protein
MAGTSPAMTVRAMTAIYSSAIVTGSGDSSSRKRCVFRLTEREPGLESIEPAAFANVRYGSDNGLESDIAQDPKSAKSGLMRRAKPPPCPSTVKAS